VAGLCEHGNEPLSSIDEAEFLDHDLRHGVSYS